MGATHEVEDTRSPRVAITSEVGIVAPTQDCSRANADLVDRPHHGGEQEHSHDDGVNLPPDHAALFSRRPRSQQLISVRTTCDAGKEVGSNVELLAFLRNGLTSFVDLGLRSITLFSGRARRSLFLVKTHSESGTIA